MQPLSFRLKNQMRRDTTRSLWLQAMLNAAKSTGPPKTLVLITDGALGDPDESTTNVNAAKAAGIRVVTVGVGYANENQLKTLATNPGLFVKAAGFAAAQLQGPIDAAGQALCGLGSLPVSPCPGSPPGTTCTALSGKPTGCCACRQTNDTRAISVHPSASAASYYSAVPNCNPRLAITLPPSTQVAYTGAKLIGFINNWCKGDYAQIVVKVRYF